MGADIVIAIIGGVAAIFVALFTPLGQYWVDRISSKKPVFSLDRYHLDNSLQLQVFAENSAARRVRPLGLFIGSRYYSKIALPRKSEKGLVWEVDLAVASLDLAQALSVNGMELRFYFDVDRQSEPVSVTVTPSAVFMSIVTARPRDISAPVTAANDTNSFIGGVLNSREVELEGDEIVLNLPVVVAGKHLQISEVHDGKELRLIQVNDLRITSKRRTSLLAIPRYAWVLDFYQCNNMTLSGVVFGHTDVGYCQGGVLKYFQCTNIQINNCELFGCGTVGISLASCDRVHIRGSRVRNCTYRIAEFVDCKTVVFEDCDFFDNEQFELITFAGTIKDVMFIRCRFERNVSSGAMISSESPLSVHPNGITFTDCLFSGNKYERISDIETVRFVNCKIEDGR